MLQGRGGKGNIFVWASGNGGGNDDDCNCDGYVGMPETISIGSITDRGGTPYFMEKCPSTFAVVPSGGEEHIGEDGSRTKIRVVSLQANFFDYFQNIQQSTKFLAFNQRNTFNGLSQSYMYYFIAAFP